MTPVKSRASLWAAAAVLIAVPLGLLYRDASQRGQPFGEYLADLVLATDDGGVDQSGPPTRGAAIHFLERQRIGEPVGETPERITHVSVIDLDGDGRQDVILCDVNQSEIT